MVEWVLIFFFVRRIQSKNRAIDIKLFFRHVRETFVPVIVLFTYCCSLLSKATCKFFWEGKKSKKIRRKHFFFLYCPIAIEVDFYSRKKHSAAFFGYSQNLELLTTKSRNLKTFFLVSVWTSKWKISSGNANEKGKK